MITVSVQGDLDGLTRKVQSMPRQIRSAAYHWLQETTAHMAERAEANAPILTGHLRAVTQPMDVVETEDGIEGGVMSPTEYAMLMHEYQIAHGPVPPPPPGATSLGEEPGERYKHGKRTGEQPVQPEGGPGGKFITRVFNYHYQKYLKELSAIINKMVAGKS
jgi:hypothetical protein